MKKRGNDLCRSSLNIKIRISFLICVLGFDIYKTNSTSMCDNVQIDSVASGQSDFNKSAILEDLPLEVLNDRRQSYAGLLPYIDVVEAALRDDRLFQWFKRHQDYMAVLEHVSKEMGNL